MNTSDNKLPSDELIRERALCLDQSFIVQAPAGSGKTGLLTQRYLKLLASVNIPEEIIAITFTRKAAAEMRDRILAALHFASETDKEPEDRYFKKTWTLARAALAQNIKKKWNLLEQTGRLRVQTIDSLCAELARQLPLLSEFGAIPEIIDDASQLYLDAALETLNYLESKNNNFSWVADALFILLQHQDNQIENLQNLIAAMLQRRDQWLRHVADLEHPQLRRDQIEPVLKEIVETALISLKDNIPKTIINDLPELLRFAAQNVAKNSSLYSCLELHELPDASVTELAKWLAISDLLLTNDNNWRKPNGVNKKIGFLAVTEARNDEQKKLFKSQKNKFKLILESLANSDEFNAFKKYLIAIRVLPDYKYNDDEWLVLESLFKVLLFSAAQLRIIFSGCGKVDFIEMLLAAKRALGDSDNITDLTLRLDNQLKHLLVDEFQDTSQNQYDLFIQLTLDWKTGDGRSLFLVGDPMQSIYRFREAEVGLFIESWENGLGTIVLEPLTLTQNFRSQKSIVDWINNNFPKIFPNQNDKSTAAVSYTSFDAFKPELNKNSVLVHPLFNRSDKDEAALILDVINRVTKINSNEKIAILCRNKSHLREIVALLNVNLISYQAVEIDLLKSQSIILDLLSLSKALLHLADRIAWLALLRAPFVGLTLNDLFILSSDHASETLYQCLLNDVIIKKLSIDGQKRIKRVIPILISAIDNRQKNSLRNWLESVWLALGGPACYDVENLLANAEVYFQLLETLENEYFTLDPESLEKHCNKLFALTDVNANENLQLMTIHKAKGLEFDTVIIPGIGKTPASDRSQLLYWCERNNDKGNPELIFGPIKSKMEDSNKTTEYLKFLEKEKISFEICRVLYVAVTRAKNSLHLIGHVNIKSDGSMAIPASNSLLHHLWPIVESEFLTKFNSLSISSVLELDISKNVTETEDGIRQKHFKNTSHTRLIADWICPTPPNNITILNTTDIIDVKEIELEFDWASETALHIGSVVHRILEQLSTHYDVTQNISDLLSQITEPCRIMLQRLGVIEQQLEMAKSGVLKAIKNTLNDQRGIWILSKSHLQARSEYKITATIENEIQHLIIDRTFIDEKNIRWVIDYKTGNHQGTGLETFLDREQQRYYEQLQRYANVMSLIDEREVKMALYFPMMQQWREW